MDDSKIQEQVMTQVRAQLAQLPEEMDRYQAGNAERFNPDYLTYDPTSSISGKKIAFLGSSITYGFAAKGISFVDYLATKDGIQITKSAISGTTLAGLEEDGYLPRLKKDFSPAENYDLFVCQLSTNDYQIGKPLGQITPSSQRENFNLETTLGAIEEVARYVNDEFHCPLAFYTCIQLEPSDEYKDLVDKLYQLQDKWDYKIIDLFNNAGLVASTKAHPNAMFDSIHPTQEGYLKVWLPFFERELKDFFTKK